MFRQPLELPHLSSCEFELSLDQQSKARALIKHAADYEAGPEDAVGSFRSQHG